MRIAQQFTAGTSNTTKSQSVKRTTGSFATIQPSAPRTRIPIASIPTDESVGYFQSPAIAGFASRNHNGSNLTIAKLLQFQQPNITHRFRVLIDNLIAQRRPGWIPNNSGDFGVVC